MRDTLKALTDETIKLGPSNLRSKDEAFSISKKIINIFLKIFITSHVCGSVHECVVCERQIPLAGVTAVVTPTMVLGTELGSSEEQHKLGPIYNTLFLFFVCL